MSRRDARVDSVTLRDGGRVEAGVVLNAGGARDAAKTAAQVGVVLPVEPRKRCAFVFECREDIGVPPLTIIPNGVAFRPEGRGFIGMASPPPEWDPVTEDVEVDHRVFDDLIWPTLARHVPVFEAIKTTSSYCCHYDVNTLDENLLIGLTPELENFYLTAGFSGHGLQQSPAVGRALSELITFGEFRTPALSRFGYRRVLTGEAIPETNCW